MLVELDVVAVMLGDQIADRFGHRALWGAFAGDIEISEMLDFPPEGQLCQRQGFLEALGKADQAELLREILFGYRQGISRALASEKIVAVLAARQELGLNVMLGRGPDVFLEAQLFHPVVFVRMLKTINSIIIFR